MYIQITDTLLQLAREPTELNYGEIMLLAHIISIGKCFMSNSSIADLFCTTERTIKRWLTNMKQKGIIKVYYENINGSERRVIVSDISPP